MITLYAPSVDDLWFKETMLGDERTMSYNRAYGGTIPFPREKWGSWHDRWITNHDDDRFYRYIMHDNVFVGEAAYHFDEEEKKYMADVIVYAPYRKRGYGRTALGLLCEAAKKRGIGALYDKIAADNPSVALFLKCGFAEVLRTDEFVLVKKDLSVQRP